MRAFVAGRPADNAAVTSAPANLRFAARIAGAGIAVSASLSALNIFAGLASRSTSVFATGMEFAGDVLAHGPPSEPIDVGV